MDERDGFSDLESTLRGGADGCSVVIRMAGSSLAQRPGDAVNLEVVNLPHGEQGRGQFGMLEIETVAKQMSFAPIELGRQLHAGETSHAAFLECLSKTRQASDAVMVGQGGIAHTSRSQACRQRLGRLLAVAEHRMAVEVDENGIVHGFNVPKVAL